MPSFSAPRTDSVSTCTVQLAGNREKTVGVLASSQKVATRSVYTHISVNTTTQSQRLVTNYGPCAACNFAQSHHQAYRYVVGTGESPLAVEKGVSKERWKSRRRWNGHLSEAQLEGADMA